MGQCAKGFKCKFSHDLNVQRKGEKIDIYSDQRDDEGIASKFCVLVLITFLFSNFLVLPCSYVVRHYGGLGSSHLGEGGGVKEKRV